MMQKQTDEFIAGYIFKEADRIILCSGLNQKIINFELQIPKIWFGVKYHQSVFIGTLFNISKIAADAIKQLTDNKYEVLWGTREENQYILFSFCLKKKPDTKKMTIKEIEKALGYKVEIVSGD
jgi:hypothetical protein